MSCHLCGMMAGEQSQEDKSRLLPRTRMDPGGLWGAGDWRGAACGRDRESTLSNREGQSGLLSLRGNLADRALHPNTFASACGRWRESSVCCTHRLERSLPWRQDPPHLSRPTRPRLADVNECLSSPCSQECANVYGSYQCYCRRGYQLSDLDGVTCEGEGAPCPLLPAPAHAGRCGLHFTVRRERLLAPSVLRVGCCSASGWDLTEDASLALRVSFSVAVVATGPRGQGLGGEEGRWPLRPRSQLCRWALQSPSLSGPSLCPLSCGAVPG